MNITAEPSAADATGDLVFARSRLALRGRRMILRRWGLRLVAVFAWVIAIVAVTFLGDFLFDLDGVSRLALALAAAVVVGWLGYRRWWPKEARQSEIDLALLIEREQPIPPHLVAALQFAETSPDDHASPQFKQAVIREAATAAMRLDPLGGFAWRPLPKRAGILSILMIIALGLAIAFPAYVYAFGSRLLLREVGYPRQTRIPLAPIPRPVVTTNIEVTPPEYAGNSPPPAPQPGARNAAVLPGSTVSFSLTSDRKPLRRVAIELFDAASVGTTDDQAATDRQRWPLTPSADRKHWRLDSVGTPLADVDRALDYRMIIVDEDGLSPARAVAGQIALRADHPPRVEARALVRVVLPSAKPHLHYSASDDFGIAAIRWRATLRRGGEIASQAEGPLPVTREGAVRVTGEVPLKISQLDPSPGDAIEIAVEATDVRGTRPGESARSERIEFQVVDRAGLLDNLRETDETTAAKLEAIIQRELGIGSDQ